MFLRFCQPLSTHPTLNGNDDVGGLALGCGDDHSCRCWGYLALSWSLTSSRYFGTPWIEFYLSFQALLAGCDSHPPLHGLTAPLLQEGLEVVRLVCFLVRTCSKFKSTAATSGRENCDVRISSGQDRNCADNRLIEEIYEPGNVNN